MLKLCLNFKITSMMKPHHNKLMSHELLWKEKFLKLCNINTKNLIPTPEYLCHELLVSRATLYRRVKKLTGKSLCSILRDIRLQRAYNYLVNYPGQRIYHAARIAGFQKVSYFSQCFIKKFGIRPSLVS